MPAITTDRSATIVTIHEPVGRFWNRFEGMGAGDRLRDIGVPSIVDSWRESVTSIIRQTAIRGSIGGDPILIHAAPLLYGDRCQGSVVLIEKHGTPHSTGSRVQDSAAPL